jgi:hypothetical protein
MAALPANNTSRWFLDYVSSSGAAAREHTASIRLSTGSNATAANAKFLQILTAIGAGNLRNGWRALRLRFQDAGAVFSVPVTMSSGLAAFVGTQSISGYQVAQEALQWTWQARSFTTGRRVGFYLFPCSNVSPSVFRSSIAPLGTTVVAALNDDTNGDVLCVDGSSVSFGSYVNINYNSYWERNLR